MDKRVIGMIVAVLVAIVLLAYFSRDILVELGKFRRPYEGAKDTEKAKDTPKPTAELLQKRAESAETRGNWAGAKRYYKMALDLKDSELAKKGLRRMDMLIEAGSLEKEGHLEESIEVYKAALPMVGNQAKVKIQEKIRKVEGRIVFDDLVARARSLEARGDHDGALKVLEDAEKVVKDKELIKALQKVRERIVFDDLLAKARSLEAEGDYDGALEVLKNAEKVAKDKERIRALREMRKRIARAKGLLPRVCRTCSGEGRIKCDACNGTTWMEPACPKCRGKGYIVCNRCSGRGRLRCTRCRGRGYAICRHCKGRGGYRTRAWAWRDCEFCVNGKIDCPYCVNGWADCRYCKGGKRTCPECRGRPGRRVRCDKCRHLGDITCPRCQGTGKISSLRR